MGTPFEVETAGRILFLEDISERAYRIDRYLSQLKLAGKLSAVAGVLLGTFSYEEGEKADNQSDIHALFKEYLEPLGVPVIAGFPAGHERYNLALPMGALVALDSDAGQVMVLEDCVVAS
jgi:muramoyltetrapeptide carboxypeptidase